MIELDTIYNEDCLEGMKGIPDGSVDAIICDLPCPVIFDIYARHYTHVQLSLDYPKKGDESRRMTFELNGIFYREGREEWGAEKGKKYLVEVLGRRTTLDGTKLWEG